MDAESLGRDLEEADHEAILERQRKAAARERHEVLQAAGAEQAGRYWGMVKKYRGLYNAVVACLPPSEARGPVDIQLGPHTLRELGTGRLVAKLHPVYTEDQDNIESRKPAAFMVSAHFVPEDGEPGRTERRVGGTEWLGCSGIRWQGEIIYDLVRLPEQGRWANDDEVVQARDELDSMLPVAQGTLDYLLQSATDSELNPDYADSVWGFMTGVTEG